MIIIGSHNVKGKTPEKGSNMKILTPDDLENMDCPCRCEETTELNLGWCKHHRREEIAVFYYKATSPKTPRCLVISCAQCRTVNPDGTILPFRFLHTINLKTANLDDALNGRR